MKRAALYAAACLIALLFVYPFAWMAVSAFRAPAAIMASPLRPWPESLDLSGFRAIASIGGTPLWSYALNSVVATLAATALGVAATGLGAYALFRRPGLPGFALVRGGFLLSIMYPNLLLVIPLYFVSFRLGLLGSLAGIVLVLSLIPLVFFIFVQFFASIPREIIEAASIDGASEWQILSRVVLPIARPVVTTATLIAFLLTWKQWFPVLVLSTGPETHTLPVALIQLNSELGVDFQATMALATLTALPVVVLFLLTQRRVMGSFVAGAVKG